MTTYSNDSKPSTTWGNDNPSKGLIFNGSTSYIQVSSSSSIDNIFETGGTATAWIYPYSTGEGGVARILSKSDYWYFFVGNISGSTAKLRFVHTSSTRDGAWISTLSPITINAWNHVAVTYSKDSLTNDPILYVNGQSIALTTTTSPLGTLFSDVGQVFLIGDNLTHTRSFYGVIDGEILLFKRILTPTEISNLYNLGTFSSTNLSAYWTMFVSDNSTVTDSSGNTNTGTAFNTAPNLFNLRYINDSKPS